MSEFQTRRSGPAGGRSTETISTTNNNNLEAEGTPRFAEDADILLAEIGRFLEASDIALSAALLEDEHGELVAAAGHAVVCHARIRRLLGVALHVDFEAVA